MKEWKKSVKFHLKLCAGDNLEIASLQTNKPWYRIREEIILSVVLTKQLHSQHGEYVDN